MAAKRGSVRLLANDVLSPGAEFSTCVETLSREVSPSVVQIMVTGYRPELFIKRPITTALIVLGIVVFGVTAFR